MSRYVPTVSDEISNQRDRVENTYQAWQRAEPDAESSAWEMYQAEQTKLNAMLKYAKVGAVAK